ncbi:MAG: hypothetical protein R3B84_17330 [Zavarzinella sp.]
MKKISILFLLAGILSPAWSQVGPMSEQGKADVNKAANMMQVAPPALAPLAPQVANFRDGYLKVWEQEMKALDGIESKVFQTVEYLEGQGANQRLVREVYVGRLKMLKPNMARLELWNNQDLENNKKGQFIYADGKYLWEFDHKAKKAYVDKLAAEGAGDNNLLSILFGTSADKLRDRYDIRPDLSDAAVKDIKNHVVFDILPKMPGDIQEFTKAQMILYTNPTQDSFMLPRRLWFMNQRSKYSITWELRDIVKRKDLAARDFAPPKLPDETWKSEWRTKPAQTPTVSNPK